MMWRRNKKKVKSNFTLIELLVSLAVFSILLLIMLQFFSGAQRLWVASENRNNVSADARVALQVIGDLLGKAYWTTSDALADTDLPFVVDCTAEDNNKLYFITDSLYQFNASDTSNLYFVSIYRGDSDDTDTYADELMIRVAGGGSGIAYCFDGTKKVSEMCTALDSVTGTVIVPNVIGFNVTAYDKGSATAYTNTTCKYPYIINIELIMLSAEDYKKWVDMGGKKTTEPDLAKEFREAQQQIFTKTVFLGEKKYDL